MFFFQLDPGAFKIIGKNDDGFGVTYNKDPPGIFRITKAYPKSDLIKIVSRLEAIKENKISPG